MDVTLFIAIIILSVSLIVTSASTYGLGLNASNPTSPKYQAALAFTYIATAFDTAAVVTILILSMYDLQKS